MKETWNFHAYQDRGMKKWGGFYLSEHTAYWAEQQSEEEKEIPKKEELTEAEIFNIINQAIQKNKQVVIQKKILNLEQKYAEDVVGPIYGSDELGIYIYQEHIPFEEIQHIEIHTPTKWSERS